MCFCKVINCMQIKFKNLSVLYMVSFLFFLRQELVTTYFHRQIDNNKYVYINSFLSPQLMLHLRKNEL